MENIFQAPYMIYVEIIECADVHSSPVPCKMMDSSVLRRTHSQDDVAISSASASATSSGNSPAELQSPRTEPVYIGSALSGNSTNSYGFDDPDCWSQEEDDIIQVCQSYWFVCHVCML